MVRHIIREVTNCKYADKRLERLGGIGIRMMFSG